MTRNYSCGGTSGWRRVVYLNMNDSNHQCPGDLEEVFLSGKRLCGRRYSAARFTCASADLSTEGKPYSHVCGRITGYQYGWTIAYHWHTYPSSYPHTQSIEGQYVDGISLTHGPPGSRRHVWTFATGPGEDGEAVAAGARCPCDSGGSGISIPTFVGQDYFCESGAVTPSSSLSQLYPGNPLWDGDGCSVAGNTCCEFNNPPYFTKQLSNMTSDDLEVRACGGYSRSRSTQGDTFVELIELYIR